MKALKDRLRHAPMFYLGKHPASWQIGRAQVLGTEGA